MRLLVTGGCGFLGSNLAAEALRQGFSVSIFDNLSRLGADRNLAWLQTLKPVRFIHGDIRDAHAISETIADFKPDLICHLAGQVAMTTSIADPRLDFETNALGTLNVLEAMRHHAPNAILAYASTNKVYGDLGQYAYVEQSTRFTCPRWPDGFSETVPLNFESPYGCSKGAADQYVLDYARVFGLKTVVFRHSSMYGGRQFATIDQGWIGWFCAQAAALLKDPCRPPFTICGSGKQVRDILHVDDVVRLYLSVPACIEKARGTAFNIGGGMANSLSLLELFAILGDLVGVRMTFTHLPARMGDQPVFVADTRLATAVFNWRPQIGARQGLTTMMQWVDSETTIRHGR